MKFIKTTLVLTLIATVFSFATTKPSPQRWRFVGDKIAAFGVDRDVLWITGNDNYRQVRIKVTGAPLHIIDMDIYFDNGDKMNVPLKTIFKQGDQSRVIDLPGGVRNLKKIEFLYETVGFVQGKARVAVWGNR